MKDWLDEMRKTINENIPFVLVGNKTDLVPEIGEVIEKKTINVFVKEERCIYLETSAKTGLNVESAFERLTEQMVKKTKT